MNQEGKNICLLLGGINHSTRVLDGQVLPWKQGGFWSTPVALRLIRSWKKRKTPHQVKGHAWMRVHPNVCACLCFLITHTGVRDLLSGSMKWRCIIGWTPGGPVKVNSSNPARVRSLCLSWFSSFHSCSKQQEFRDDVTVRSELTVLSPLVTARGLRIPSLPRDRLSDSSDWVNLTHWDQKYLLPAVPYWGSPHLGIELPLKSVSVVPMASSYPPPWAGNLHSVLDQHRPWANFAFASLLA